MCVIKKKIPLSFLIIWCGTFWGDSSHAQNKHRGRLDLMLLQDPRKSGGLITAIPFKSVLWHPTHKKLQSLIQMNLMNIYTSK